MIDNLPANISSQGSNGFATADISKFTADRPPITICPYHSQPTVPPKSLNFLFHIFQLLLDPAAIIRDNARVADSTTSLQLQAV